MQSAAIDEIFAAFDRYGHERYGERVTQLDHALQCAQLAALEGANDSLVAATLLHDFGHLVDGRGDLAERDSLDGQHEAVGAERLSAWFGPTVVRPIALHVAAKRYLCAASPGYFKGLSPASRLSLELQGGAHSAAEAERFLAEPFAQDAVRLRRWDDQGKVAGLPPPPPLGSYRALLAGLMRAA
jgi:phosphonate degradation associated HDIG domain protein